MLSVPKVFVSYSHDGKEHEEWVLKLATHLISHGVDVILDQFDLHIGSDLRFFMEQGLNASTMVLCICSENYVNKVNVGCGGSGYEGMIMTQELLINSNAEYIIPIIRNNDSNKKVPTALGSKVYIDFSDNSKYYDKYRELLEKIYGEDKKKKPLLGINPFSSTTATEIDIKTNIEKELYCSPAMSGNVTFRFDNNNGNYTIGTGEYAFKTHWSRSGNDSIYFSGKIGYKHDSVDFPNIEQVYKFDFTSSVRTIRTGNVFVCQNEYNHFVAIKLGKVKSSNHGYPYDEMQFEYKILAI